MYEAQRHERTSCAWGSLNVLHYWRQGSRLVEEKARGVGSEEKERARVKGMHD